MSHLTAVDGTTINFRTVGDGPPVLLVHGITEQSQMWEPVEQRLVEGFGVITVDLRGHGDSGTAVRYDLAAMAGDIVAVIDHLELADQTRLVGHSLGGAVVSAVGAATPVASVVNVDQSLQLGGFKDQLVAVEAQLRDPATFDLVMGAMFDALAGTMLAADELARINALRRSDRDVVLGVWDQLLTQTVEEIGSTIETALAPYTARPVPYLALFGVDPGPDYSSWLQGHIPGAEVEVWDDHGHYPHLVDPDRFVERLVAFWGD